MSSLQSIGVFIAAFFLLIAIDCHSQEVQQGTIPQLIISYAISKEVSLRSSLASRQTFNSENSTSSFDYVLTDWTTLISLKTGIDYSIQIGYLLRLEEGHQVHRSIQRASFATPLNVGRIAQRVGLDQTLASNDKPVFRVRYRLGYEGPLNGMIIDAQEFYLKLNFEGLYKYQSGYGEIELIISEFKEVQRLCGGLSIITSESK